MKKIFKFVKGSIGESMKGEDKPLTKKKLVGDIITMILGIGIIIVIVALFKSGIFSEVVLRAETLLFKNVIETTQEAPIVEGGQDDSATNKEYIEDIIQNPKWFCSAKMINGQLRYIVEVRGQISIDNKIKDCRITYADRLIDVFHLEDGNLSRIYKGLEGVTTLLAENETGITKKEYEEQLNANTEQEGSKEYVESVNQSVKDAITQGQEKQQSTSTKPTEQDLINLVAQSYFGESELTMNDALVRWGLENLQWKVENSNSEPYNVSVTGNAIGESNTLWMFNFIIDDYDNDSSHVDSIFQYVNGNMSLSATSEDDIVNILDGILY